MKSNLHKGLLGEALNPINGNWAITVMVRGNTVMQRRLKSLNKSVWCSPLALSVTTGIRCFNYILAPAVKCREDRRRAHFSTKFIVSKSKNLSQHKRVHGLHALWGETQEVDDSQQGDIYIHILKLLHGINIRP